MASEQEADRITQEYLHRWPDSKRAKSWTGRMVHIQTENGVWRTNGHGYTWAHKPDAWVLPFEEAQKCVAHCGPEKQATFIAARPAPASVEDELYRAGMARKRNPDIAGDMPAPAPAATETGLETRAWLHPAAGWAHASEGEIIPHCLKGHSPIPLVARSQAEELLATERANTEIALEQRNMTIAELARLEADNAAKDARIKELSEALDKQRELDNESTLYHYNRAKALEAKLAAAEADAIGYRSTIDHLTQRAETAEASASKWKTAAGRNT